MVVGPVVYEQPKNFLEGFQHDDFLSLQAVTIATAMWENPILCNGANLCYMKEDFYRVGGFKGHEKLQSGDDVLLMESFLVNGLEVDLIETKTLPVITQPCEPGKNFYISEEGGLQRPMGPPIKQIISCYLSRYYIVYHMSH